ncbi:MAG: DUF3168 domain-containing protein [Acidobacteriota bacterium]|nr:DUF3168 domain-containing protein [Acidobacteriota bacterium]
MADIRQAVFSQLSGTAGLSALIASRIYPKVLPQQPTMPAIVYQLIDNDREQVHRGQTTGTKARVQLTVWGNSEASVSAVKEQMRLAMIAAHGSVASVTIDGVTCEGEVEGYEPDTMRHFIALDFFVWHREAAA